MANKNRVKNIALGALAIVAAILLLHFGRSKKAVVLAEVAPAATHAEMPVPGAEPSVTPSIAEKPVLATPEQRKYFLGRGCFESESYRCLRYSVVENLPLINPSQESKCIDKVGLIICATIITNYIQKGSPDSADLTQDYMCKYNGPAGDLLENQGKAFNDTFDGLIKKCVANSRSAGNK